MSERILTHEHAPYWEGIHSRLRMKYPNATYMKVNQTETIKHFIEQELGIAFLPKSVCSFGMLASSIKTREVKLTKDCYSKTYFISKYMTEEGSLLFKQIHSIYHQGLEQS